MKNFTRINANDLQLGMRFSAPVFFDDGENMFLAEGKAVKHYHLAAIKRWNIKNLLTYGHLLDDRNSDPDELDPDDFAYELESVEEMNAV